MALITTPSEFVTRSLSAKDYTNPNDTSSPAGVVSALSTSRAWVRGWVIGPDGHYAYFSTTGTAFQSPPIGVQGLFPSAMAVPCGGDFEFFINAGQQIFAMASISPSVPWGGPDDLVSIAYSVTYLSPEEVIPDNRPAATALPTTPPVPAPVAPPPQIIVQPGPQQPIPVNVQVTLPTIPGLPVNHPAQKPPEDKPPTIRGPKARWMKSGR